MNLSFPMPDTFFLSNDSEAEVPRGNFDRSVVDEVWEATDVIPGNDTVLWRRDSRGSSICRSEYGNQQSSYGWEIVDDSDGLKAVHFENL